MSSKTNKPPQNTRASLKPGSSLTPLVNEEEKTSVMPLAEIWRAAEAQQKNQVAVAKPQATSQPSEPLSAWAVEANTITPAGGTSVMPSQVVVVFACKGGSGSTALSVNIAHDYAHQHFKTCLVDLDLQLGDGLAALALQPRLSLAQALAFVKKGETLNPTLFPAHASGVYVISQVGSIDDLDQINAEGIAALIESLRKTFDAVVIDGVRDFSDNVLAVLDVTDKIVLVTVQEVLAIRRARWAFKILRKIGFDPHDMTVVANGFDAESEISFMTLKRIFEPSHVMTVPKYPSLVLQALNRGVPFLDLNPTHTLTRHVGLLAQYLRGELSLEKANSTLVYQKSWWSRIKARMAR